MKDHEAAVWRDEMRLKINHNNMMKSALIPDGFTADENKALPLESAFSDELLGIDAFDQPGVEVGKKAAYALLGKPGFDEKRAELAARPAEYQAYIL